MRSMVLAIAALAAVPALSATTTLSTTLAGSAEAPGPGAPDGKGAATLAIDPDKGQICYTVTETGLDTPTMAHIHKGAVGAPGPVVVPLDAPATGSSKGCATVAADVIKAILASPADYYVNVHTAAFPKGAIRGQLGS